MNNKVIVPIGAAIVVVFGIVGFFLFRNSQSGKVGVNTQAPVEEKMMENVDETAKLFTDAFEGNSSIKCTYTQEGMTSTVYIKRGMMRSEITGDVVGSNGNMIFKDPIVYTWQTGQTQGYMIDTSNFDDQSEQPQQYTKPEDVRTQLEIQKPVCTKENIPDSMFEVPTDVDFQSMDKMMQDAMEQIPDNIQLPEGYQIPEGFQNSAE